MWVHIDEQFGGMFTSLLLEVKMVARTQRLLSARLRRTYIHTLIFSLAPCSIVVIDNGTITVKQEYRLGLRDMLLQHSAV